MKTRILLSFILLFITGLISGQIIHVPGDYPTIQEGINASSEGDTVLVAEDTYYENIRFMGKAITLGSEYILDGDTNHINNTIIDGSQPTNPDTAAVVMFLHEEDTTSILNGFTITGGTGIVNMTWQFRGGGGIYASGAGAKIINNKITNNQVEYMINAGGAGLQFMFGAEERWAVVENNIISHNHSIAHDYSAFGAGIWSGIKIIIRNNTIEHNTCTNNNQITDGAGIEVETVAGLNDAMAIIENNIIRYNLCSGNTEAAGAGFMSLSSSCILKNNEFTHNSAIAADGIASGGGFYINYVDSGVLVQNNIVRHNTLDGNVCWAGGARIRIVGYAEILNNEFCENTINSYDNGFGGGLVINRPPSINKVYGNLISNNVMYENSGYTYGGACYLYKTDTVPLEFGNNILDSNNASLGGAMYIYNSYNLNMYNNVFMDNYAEWHGGAIRFWYSADDKEFEGDNEATHDFLPGSISFKSKTVWHDLLANNAFVNNVAESWGGAVCTNYEDRSQIFLNNIFWGNVANNANDIYCDNASQEINVAHCDIDPDEVRGVIVGYGNFLQDPLFEDDFCHLNEGSVCIEAGESFLEIDGQMYYCPDHDIDGEARPMNEKPDVGVDEKLIEWIHEIPNRSPFSLQVGPNPSSGVTHLRYSISDIRYSIIEIYSANGVKVKTLFTGKQQAGEHEMQLYLSDLPDGVYFIRLLAGEMVETTKIIILK